MTTIQDQLNALMRFSQRNNQTIYQFEIIGGYTGDFTSQDGEVVFAYLSHPKSGKCEYTTLAMLARYSDKRAKELLVFHK